MTKFIIKTTLVLILVFLFDKLFYFSLNILPHLQYDKRLEYILTDEIKSEILILGSSRAARDILAIDMEEHLGRSCYNLGYPGSNIEFHTFLLKHIVRLSVKPKTVLLVLDDPDELVRNSTINFRWDRIYPLVKYNELNNLLLQKTNKNPLLNKFMYSIRIKENFPQNFVPVPPSPLEVIKSNGSMPISLKGPQWKEMKYRYKTSNYSIDHESSELRQKFIKFIEICQSNGINLILVYPPNFYSMNSSFINRIQELSPDDVKHYIANTKNFTNKKYFTIEDISMRRAQLF